MKNGNYKKTIVQITLNDDDIKSLQQVMSFCKLGIESSDYNRTFPKNSKIALKFLEELENDIPFHKEKSVVADLNTNEPSPAMLKQELREAARALAVAGAIFYSLKENESSAAAYDSWRRAEEALQS